MRLEIDPHGDTLVTIMDTEIQPSVPCDTDVEATAVTSIGKQFLVSKKHLMLASRRASKVLGGSFKEATPKEDGLFHWDIEPIFDLKAFEIVLQIIHGQTRHVPEKVDVDVLAQIAAIVDDLECQDSVWFFAKRWLSQMKGPVLQRLSEDTMRWILISFVFEDAGIFKAATNTAIRYSTNIIHTLDLPIRSKILEDIEKQREFLLAHLFDRLQNLQSQLLEQSLGCNQGCRAMMYGTLSQGMKSSLLLPLPPPPYTSLTIGSTLQRLRTVKGVDYYWPKPDSTSQTHSGLFGGQPPAGAVQTPSVTIQTPSGFFGGQPPTNTIKTPSGLFGGPPSKPNPYLSTDSSRLVEKVPPNFERDKCRIEHHLKGLLDSTEGNIEGLKLSNYLST